MKNDKKYSDPEIIDFVRLILMLTGLVFVVILIINILEIW